MKKVFLLLSIGVFLFSCQHETSKDKHANVDSLRIQADSLSTVAQKLLVSNLTKAIADSGLVYAVDFCHLHASPLTDSAAQGINATIERIADKTRNPNNALKSKTDQDVFAAFKAQTTLQDSLVEGASGYVYYKRINMAMPTCLKCHGPEKELDKELLAKLDEHYPGDEAKGYKLNDFRALWKVSF